MKWPWLILLMLPAALFQEARAHPAQFTTLQVTIDAGGRFDAALNIDILAYALGETSLASTNEELQALLDGPRPELARALADAGERFREEVVIRTDAGNVIPASWTLPGMPDVDAVLARKLQPRILMPGEIDFSGTLPAAARTLSIRLPYILGDTMQVFELPNGDSAAEPVSAGDYSQAVRLPPPQPPPRIAPAPAPAGSGQSIPKAFACALVVTLLLGGAARLISLSRKAKLAGPQ